MFRMLIMKRGERHIGASVGPIKLKLLCCDISPTDGNVALNECKNFSSFLSANLGKKNALGLKKIMFFFHSALYTYCIECPFFFTVFALNSA